MADLRYDPTSGIWVANARKRRERPMEFVPMEQLHKQVICPFCRGNEDETPQTIVAYRNDGSRLTADDDPESWTARIVPNKYPSLSQATNLKECGPYRCSDRDGIQELVVPTPRHVTSLSELSQIELSTGILACQQRMETIEATSSVEHLMLFMNCRLAAGASLGHIHLQLMGTPVISTSLAQRMARNVENVQRRGENLMTTLLNWELQVGKRILKETENFVLLCPYASRFSFQVWIVPKSPNQPFSSMPREHNAELGLLCQEYIQKLEQLMDHPAYNLLLNQAPIRHRKDDHWFIEIFPRLNQLAGYELGTDVWVNPVPPETAVKRLLT